MNEERKAAVESTVDSLVGDLGICGEIEDVTATSETLAGNEAKAEWHKGKGAGLRQAQAMLRDVLANAGHEARRQQKQEGGLQ